MQHFFLATSQTLPSFFQKRTRTMAHLFSLYRTLLPRPPCACEHWTDGIPAWQPRHSGQKTCASRKFLTRQFNISCLVMLLSGTQFLMNETSTWAVLALSSESYYVKHWSTKRSYDSRRPRPSLLHKVLFGWKFQRHTDRAVVGMVEPNLVWFVAPTHRIMPAKMSGNNWS